MGAEPIVARFYARFTHSYRLLCNPQKWDDEKRAKNRMCEQGLNLGHEYLHL